MVDCILKNKKQKQSSSLPRKGFFFKEETNALKCSWSNALRIVRFRKTNKKLNNQTTKMTRTAGSSVRFEYHMNVDNLYTQVFMENYPGHIYIQELFLI